MPSSGGRSNTPQSDLPIPRAIILTSRIARARLDFRTRGGLIANLGGPPGIAAERYFNRHRQIDRHNAGERIGTGAWCFSCLEQRRLTAATDQGHSQRADEKRPQTILPKRLSFAAALAALGFRAGLRSMMQGY
jgi:hypothetical protein